MHLDGTNCGDLCSHVGAEVTLDHLDVAHERVVLFLVVLFHRALVIFSNLIERRLRFGGPVNLQGNQTYLSVCLF